MRKLFLLSLVMVLSASLFLVGCTSSEEASGPTENNDPAPAETSTGSRLDTVKNRGTIIVGVNNQLPGFGYVGSGGEYEGFDVEYGKVMAAAIFGDATQVEYRPLNATERFTALQTGEIDILIRNTTWTTNRDAELGLAFGPTTFYDGQGLMVRADSGFTRLEDLAGARIGVDSGTTTELNLTDQFRKRGIDFELVTYGDQDAVVAAYEQGAIDAWTTDRSGLVSRLAIMADPSEHYILEEVMSKEPLGPAVMDGDSKFFDVMQWAVFATIQAEEFGITSENIDSFLDSDDPEIMRFLGTEGNLGEQLGLSNDFAYQIVKQVGNYSEIFDRNLGPGTIFNLQRGDNALWTEGGLMYSMPFR